MKNMLKSILLASFIILTLGVLFPTVNTFAQNSNSTEVVNNLEELIFPLNEAVKLIELFQLQINTLTNEVERLTDEVEIFTNEINRLTNRITNLNNETTDILLVSEIIANNRQPSHIIINNEHLYNTDGYKIQFNDTFVSGQIINITSYFERDIFSEVRGFGDQLDPEIYRLAYTTKLHTDINGTTQRDTICSSYSDTGTWNNIIFTNSTNIPCNLSDDRLSMTILFQLPLDSQTNVYSIHSSIVLLWMINSTDSNSHINRIYINTESTPFTVIANTTNG